MDEKITALAMAVKTADGVMKQHRLLMEQWHYEVGLMLKAIEQVWRKIGEPAYFNYIRANIDYFIKADGSIKTYTVNEYNLDQINTGKIALMMYQATKDEKYRKACYVLREQLKKHPRTSEGGFWHKQIYPQQMWLDGVYMADPFYAEFAVTFDESEALDDVLKQFCIIYEKARDQKTGLLYHAWNATKEEPWSDPVTGCSPNIWGRAMGWYAMAVVDTLDFITAPEQRQVLLNILKPLMEAVLKVQDETSGLWYQVLDQGSRAGNYLEASASGMFIYTLAKAAKNGYLDDTYLAAAQRGYAGMLKHFVTEDFGGVVHLNQICNMAGLGKYKEDMEYRSGSYDYYISEPVVADDYKGMGPFIMAGIQLS